MLKAIVSIFGGLISIIVIFLLFLYNGIKIEHYSNDTINIDSLYIKFDKKLILSIEKLELKPSKDESSKTDLSIIPTVYDILKYINYVEIKEIIFEKENISLIYKDYNLLVKHKLAKVDTKFSYIKNELIANSNIELEKHKIKLKSYIVVDLNKQKIKYNISSNKIKDISIIDDFIMLTPEIRNLLYNQLNFNFIKLNNANGEILVSKINDFDIKSLKANLKIENINLKYDSLPEVVLNTVLIDLKEGRINIDIGGTNDSSYVTYNGDINSTIDGKTIEVDGDILYKDINITTKTKIKDEILNYQISTNKFKDIKVFEEFVTIPKGIRKWAIERLKAKYSQINNVSGNIYLNGFNVDFSTLRVDATLYDILMDFNPNRAYPLKADKVNLNFDGKDMFISLKNPKSNDVNLNGSNALIYDMFGESGLILNLQTISPLNATLVRAVQSYDIELPNELGINQTKGASDIKVKIDIPFTDRATDIYVNILNENSTIKIKENDIEFKKFDFTYKENKVFIKNTDAVYEDKNIDIKDLLFDIKRSNLKLELDAYDKKKTFFVTLKNKTNLEHNITSGDIFVKYIDINNTVDMKNKHIPYNIPFGKNTTIEIPSFGIYYYKKDLEHNLTISDIVKFRSFIKPLQDVGLQEGKLKVYSKDLKDINIGLTSIAQNNDTNQSFDINLTTNVNLENNRSSGDILINKLRLSNNIDINNSNIPFNINFQNLDDIFVKINLDLERYGLYHKNNLIKNIDIDSNIKNNKLINISNPLDIFSLNIDLNDMLLISFETNHLGLEYRDDLNETNKTKDTIKEDTTDKNIKRCENVLLDLPNINGVMNNGYFKYNNHLVNYDQINLDTNETKVKLTLDNNITNISFKLNQDLNLTVKKLNKEFINDLAGTKLIDGGILNFNVYGSQCNLNSNIDLKNIEIKNAAVLNKIFLVINSVPALINPLLILPNAYRFAKDGFTLSSYTAKKGKINLNINRDTNIVSMDKINIKGVHSDFKLKGKINLNDNTIDSKLDIIFMKDYARIINHIPVVRYILLGEDKRFSYSVNVDGNITNPNINNHIGKETVMAPLNIIKRIITLPLLPFKDYNRTEEEIKYHNEIVEKMINQ
ncbi:MAG: AsmA-like C-terminal domain-containing protein [Campylobacterota bacterium]|nr:AsmA-like C-terminal domain-containing protein [Campylobacterota bacterium]